MTNQSKPGKAGLNVLLETRDLSRWCLENLFISQRSGSDRRGADGVRAENFPRIHYIGKFSTRFKR